MKALAYRNYARGQDGYVCVPCVQKDQLKHEYSTLFFFSTRPCEVDEKIKCAWCGSPVGSYKSSHEEKRITSMVEGGPQDEEEKK